MLIRIFLWTTKTIFEEWNNPTLLMERKSSIQLVVLDWVCESLWGVRSFLNESVWCTNDEAQQFVGQQAGGDEGHQQPHIQPLGQLRLNPHEQAAHTNGRDSTGVTASAWGTLACADQLTSVFSPGCLPASQTDSERGGGGELKEVVV